MYIIFCLICSFRLRCGVICILWVNIRVFLIRIIVLKRTILRLIMVGFIISLIVVIFR